VVGVATHDGSWVIGVIGLTAAVAAGVIAIRAFLQVRDLPRRQPGGSR
jgi:hypothetical protein